MANGTRKSLVQQVYTPVFNVIKPNCVTGANIHYYLSDMEGML